MSPEREDHSWISYGHVHSARSRGLAKTIGPGQGAPHEGDLRGAPARKYAGDDHKHLRYDSHLGRNTRGIRRDAEANSQE